MRSVVGLDPVRLVEEVLPSPGPTFQVVLHAPTATSHQRSATAELAEVDVAGDRAACRRATRWGSSSRRGTRRDLPTPARAARARRARRRRVRCACSGCRSAGFAIPSADPFARVRDRGRRRGSRTGTSTTGAAAWNAASPRARIGTRRAGLGAATDDASRRVPSSAAVIIQSTVPSDPLSMTLGHREVGARPPHALRLVERRWGSGPTARPSRTTARSPRRARLEPPGGGETRPFPRDRPAPRRRTSSRIGFRRAATTPIRLRATMTARRRSAAAKLLGVTSTEPDRARATAASLDAPPGRSRAARGHHHRRSPSTSCCPKVIVRVLRVPAALVGRVRVDRRGARVRGDQLRDGVDAAAARDPDDAVARDRDVAARGQRAELDPARRARPRARRCRCGCSAKPASTRRPRRRA